MSTTKDRKPLVGTDYHPLWRKDNIVLRGGIEGPAYCIVGEGRYCADGFNGGWYFPAVELQGPLPRGGEVALVPHYDDRVVTERQYHELLEFRKEVNRTAERLGSKLWRLFADEGIPKTVESCKAVALGMLRMENRSKEMDLTMPPVKEKKR